MKGEEIIRGRHFRKWKDGLVYCPDCREYLDPSKFQKNNTKKAGLQCYCKACSKVRWSKRDPQKVRSNHIRHYGLDWDTYVALYSKHKGLCAICGKPIKLTSRKGDNDKVYIDHSHATKDVRGLLCHNCNTGLGCFQDSILVLREAILYLMNCRED